MPESIVEHVSAHAKQTPEKICVVDSGGKVSYGELWDRVAGCAKAIIDAGASKEDCVVVENSQDADYIVALLAIQLIGAQAVPLEKNASAARNSDIARKVRPVLHVGPKPLDEFASAAFAPYERICHIPRAWHDSFPAADDVSEILFSTGTTGIPKGVVLTHKNDIAMSGNVIEGLQMKPETVELIPVPLNHSYGLRRMNANLVNGSTCLICDGVMALKRVFNMMDEHHANAMALAPNMLTIFFKLSGNRLGNYADALDYVQLSSAPVSEQDKDRLAKLLPNTRLYNFYGSTEAGATCLYDFNAMADKTNCIGMPIGTSRFIVVDDDRKPIQSSPNNMGIIASAGDVVMRGYFEEPELTRETLVDGFVYTKDLGYIDEDGLVYILGRTDDVINFGGIKVAPEEIEGAVLANPIVHDCACVPLRDEIAGQIPVLCVTLEDNVEYDAKEFRRFLASALGANERPQRVEVIDEIPRTYNGKIKRKELVARLSEKA